MAMPLWTTVPFAATGSATLRTLPDWMRMLFGKQTITVAGTTALDGNARFVFVDATAGNITITLPPGSVWGSLHAQELIIRRVDTSANTVTIQRAGSDTINGATTSLVLAVNMVGRFILNGASAWLTI